MKRLFLLVALFVTALCSASAQMILALDFKTGSDDLRGGNDNVNLIVIMKSGSQVRFDNINASANWPGNSEKKGITRILSTGTPADIATLRLETTFSGGIGGDNWDLAGFTANTIVSNVATKLVEVTGNPVYRFTGTLRVKDFPSVAAGTTNMVSAAPVMTGFNPAVHGFKFVNQFSNVIISGLDIVQKGLCAGMSYASLDYYKLKKTIPQQTYLPSEGMPLQSYIWNRHTTSNTANLDRYADFNYNPSGSRTKEMFTWGVQAGSGQLGVLMTYINKGEPVPIHLVSCGDNCTGNHCVLAIGYQLGRYNGNPISSQSGSTTVANTLISDLVIFVYDPNKPGEIMKLKADYAKTTYYFYHTDPNDTYGRWRAYFVDTKYSPVNPPVIPNNPRELIVSFYTGGDDLRGGNDNVNVIIFYRTGTGAISSMRFDNVNNGKRWVNDSKQGIGCPLPEGFDRNTISSIRIETTFTGGIAGDNWNLNRVTFETRINGIVEGLADKSGSPLYRFTGSAKTFDIQIR